MKYWYSVNWILEHFFNIWGEGIPFLLEKESVFTLTFWLGKCRLFCASKIARSSASYKQMPAWSGKHGYLALSSFLPSCMLKGSLACKPFVFGKPQNEYFGKQWRPTWNAALWYISSGSTLLRLKNNYRQNNTVLSKILTWHSYICTMDCPKLNVPIQKEESISIQRVKAEPVILCFLVLKLLLGC